MLKYLFTCRTFFACAKSVLVCAFADDTTGHNHIVSHIFVLIVS